MLFRSLVCLQKVPAMVLAPPELGKTYVAKQLEGYLLSIQDDPPAHLRFGTRFCRTGFETHGRGVAVQPSWWNDWRDRSERACWIVDAVDEDARREDNHRHEILDLIESIGGDTRRRLTLLVFCREGERDLDFEERVRSLYPQTLNRWHAGFREFRLAPLDPGEAKALVGPERFDRVLHLIREHGLTAMAGEPRVLNELAGWPVDEAVGHKVLRRRILERMLSPKTRHVTGEPAADDAFDAVSRVAAVLTFAGLESVRAAGSHGISAVEDVFPRWEHRSDVLRAAAAVVLPRVTHVQGDERRFRQQHIREWFAAFAVGDVDPDRLRPLLVNAEGKPRADQRGLHAMLALCGTSGIKRLIEELHQQIPPLTDAVTRTLTEVCEYLNRLEADVDGAPDGHSLWGEDRFAELHAPGVGAELARRLADPERSWKVKDLLLSIAKATGADETLGPAADIACDRNAHERLRRGAVVWIRERGGEAELSRLANLLDELRAQPADGHLLAWVLDTLYHREHLSWAATAAALPDSDSHVVDQRQMLSNKLRKDLTLDRARLLLRNSGIEEVFDTDEHEVLLKRGRVGLVTAALNLLLKADTLTPDDYQFLIPLALHPERTNWRYCGEVDWAFGRDRDARQRLFLAGLEHDPHGEQPGHHLWGRSLQPEDVEWLAGVVEERREASPWLVAFLLQRLEDQRVEPTVRLRLRAQAAGWDSRAVPEFDATFQRRREENERLLHKMQAQREAAEARMLDREALIREAIDADLSPCDRLRRLGSLAGPGAPFGPRNVRGEWEDLPSQLRARVVKVLRDGLLSCEPTPIPDGGEFSTWTLYEAAAFEHVIHESQDFRPPAPMVRRWLPAVLRCTSPADEMTISRSFDAAPDAAEDAVLGELRRALRSDPASTIVMENLPSEHWSPRLAEATASLLESDIAPPKAKADLLRLLAERNPHVAQPMAQRWVEMDDEELRAAAVDVFLLLDPPIAIKHLRDMGPQRLGLERLNALTEFRREWGEPLQAWPVEVAADLYRLLREQYPPHDRPHRPMGRAYAPTRAEGLHDLRQRMLHDLLTRQGDAAKAAQDTLAAEFDDVAQQLHHHRSRAAVDQTLDTLMQPLPRGAAAPARDVVRLLIDRRYRLIRDSGDLRRLVTAELRLIQKDARHHLAMLYRPHEKRSVARQRLHEEALQAYVHCRLQDRLPAVNAGVEVTRLIVNRETVEAANQRHDVKVQAQTLDGGVATLVIEIKWSDHHDAHHALIDQLAERYLAADHLTDGIYLLGWCGQSARNDCPRGIDLWQQHLDQQAAQVTDEHKGLVIDAVIFDLTWTQA